MPGNDVVEVKEAPSAPEARVLDGEVERAEGVKGEAEDEATAHVIQVSKSQIGA